MPRIRIRPKEVGLAGWRGTRESERIYANHPPMDIPLFLLCQQLQHVLYFSYSIENIKHA